MLNTFFSSIITSTVSWQAILLCTLSSVILGALSAGIYCYRNTYTKSFVVTLSLLPVIVQTVIMLVNGNLGAGVAVMGASPSKIRSCPVTAIPFCVPQSAMMGTVEAPRAPSLKSLPT